MWLIVEGVYVKVSVRRRGDVEYRYLQLVEAVRTGSKVSQRTLLRLGEVSELRASGQLDRIITALQQHAADTWLPTRELSADGAPGFGAVAAVHTIFQQLGLDRCLRGARKNSATLADSVFVMIANRLISPWSKRRTITEWVDADVQLPTGIVAPSLDQLYRALDAIADLKPVVEQHLYGELITLLGLICACAATT